MRDRIFKGATRPALLLGVPLVALILVQGSLFLLALWLYLLVSGFASLVVSVGACLALLVMRNQTRADDQRLRQLGLRLRLRGHGWLSGNVRYWSCAASSARRSRPR